VTGPGPIGLLCAAVALRSGASVLVCGTSRDEHLRLPTARSLGFAAVNLDREPVAKAVAQHFGNEPPDLWVEASGSVSAFQAAIGLLRRGGSLLAVGMYDREFPFFASAAVRAELSFHFSYASGYRDYIVAMDLMREGSLSLRRLVQLFPLERAEEVFREAEAGRTLKPILVP
jgi:L-iditol 2-dehydrogenase